MENMGMRGECFLRRVLPKIKSFQLPTDTSFPTCKVQPSPERLHGCRGLFERHRGEEKGKCRRKGSAPNDRRERMSAEWPRRRRAVSANASRLGGHAGKKNPWAARQDGERTTRTM